MIFMIFFIMLALPLIIAQNQTTSCSLYALTETVLPESLANASLPVKVSRCNNAQCSRCESIQVKFNLTVTYLEEMFLYLMTLDTMVPNWNVTCSNSLCGCTETIIYLTPKESDLQTIIDVEDLQQCNQTSPQFHDSGSAYQLGSWPVNLWGMYNTIKGDSQIPGSNISYVNVTIGSFTSNNTKRVVDFVIDFNTPNLVVTTSTSDPYFVIWTFRSFSGYFESSGGTETFTLESSILIQTAILSVDIYYNRTLVVSQSFQVDKQDICTVNECTFICWEYLTHYLCYSLTTQILIAGSFLLSSLLFVFFIIFVIYKLFHYPCCSNFWTKIGITKADYQINKHKYKCYPFCKLPEYEDGVLGNEEFNNEEVEMDQISSEEEKPRFRIQRNGTRTFGSKTMMCIALICMIQIGSAECIANTILSSNIVQCTTAYSNLECSVTINTQVILPSLGSSACITLLDPVSNTVVGDLTVTYDKMFRTALMRFKYFTADYDMLAQSKMYCPTTNDICPDGSCDCVGIGDKSYFTGGIVDYPGWTVCESVPGCAGNGCTFCSQAEVAGRIAMAMSGTAYYVNRIEEVISVPQIIYTLRLGNDVYSDGLDMPFTGIMNGNITMTLIGELQTNQITFGDYHVIGRGTEVFLYPASPDGEPVLGTVGDAQADYHTWLEYPPYYVVKPQVPPAYSLSENMITTYGIKSGIKNMRANAYQFPTTYAGILWDATPNALTGIDPSPGPVEIFINSPTALKMTFGTSTICPVLEDIYMNGCFTCDSGASLIVRAYSSCDVGSVTLKIVTQSRITVFQQSIWLMSVSQNHTIPIYSLDRFVDLEVILSYRDNNSSLAKSWTLDPPPLIPQSQINMTGSQIPSDPSGLSFSDWWGSLTGPLAIAKWIISIVLGAILTVIITGILAVILKWCISSYKHIDMLV